MLRNGCCGTAGRHCLRRCRQHSGLRLRRGRSSEERPIADRLAKDWGKKRGDKRSLGPGPAARSLEHRHANSLPLPQRHARALFEALWPEPMRRLMVLDVHGGIAVISAAFDIIVDVGAARIPTLPKGIDICAQQAATDAGQPRTRQ